MGDGGVKEEDQDLDPKTEKYLQELLQEKHAAEPESHSARLLQDGK